MHMLRLVILILVGALAAPLTAYDRGDVLLDNRVHIPNVEGRLPQHQLWRYSGWRYADLTAWALNEKRIPFTGGPGHFLMTRPDTVVFHYQQTVSVWDGVYRLSTDEGKGYIDIFANDSELAEIAPMRSGNFLVAERWTDPTRRAKLIEFSLQKGIVAEYLFPELIDPATSKMLGATHIELLADHCTVLYTLGHDDPGGSRVRRLNICTQQPQSDFASLIPGQYAGAIRQLPTGEVIVANGSMILQFTPEGSLPRFYDFSGVTHLALTPDGTAFWAAGVYLGKAYLRRFEPGMPGNAPQSIQLGNDGWQTIIEPLHVSDLVVVGEWRAASAGSRSRSVRKRQ